MRRFALAGSIAALTACGLTFSPGDYEAPGTTTDAGVLPDVTPPPPDTGARVETGPVDAGGPPTRVALFAGRREAVAGENAGMVSVAETMLTTIDSAGALGKFTFDPPPPSGGAWTHAALLGGEVFVHTASTAVHAPLGDRISGAWQTIAFGEAPDNGLKPWVLDPHGALSGTGAGGKIVALETPRPYLARFVDGGVEWAKINVATPVARRNTTLARVGSHVYVLGGETPGTGIPAVDIVGHSEVEVASLSESGEPGDFKTTTALPALDDGGAYAVYAPITATTSDRLFVLGGLTSSASSSSLGDVALVAKVKDDGALDAWTVLPKLPSVMNAFAAVVTPEWLVVYGGENAPSKVTDDVYRLAIHADGSYGTSWEHAGALPARRGNIVGVTY